ncbi:MAG TPA: hypothetical protein VE690_22610 [Rhodopila sp.]|nr:hypothetical protein [Rhodopila sp.]
MATDLSRAAFDALYDRSGLTLSEAQKATLYQVYPLMRAMIERATVAMPREAEPALTFKPEAE